MLLAIRVRVSGEPLSIVRKTEVKHLRIGAKVKVILNNIQRALDTASVRSNVITAVHNVIAHNVDHVDRLEDLRARLFVPSNHVLLTAWNGDRECLVADFFSQSGEELGVGLNFGDFVGVGNLLVVLAVSAGVFPVNI